jgi:uncharacterized damage-inducible protein DinB
MINQTFALRLAQYKSWADELTYDAVAKLPEAEVHKERRTLFKSIIGTLNHNIVVDLIWKAHLSGEAHGFTSRAVLLHPSLGDAHAAQTQINDWLSQWVAAQTDESLTRSIRFTFISGEVGELTAGEMFMHLVNHSTYHRGWIAEMFFEVPAKAPTTDLPVFLLQAAHQNKVQSLGVVG